jgi:CBS domain-containing protein
LVPLPAGKPYSDPKQEKEASMAKRVREVMTSNPCSIDAAKPVSHAAKMMKDENVGIAPVVEGERLVGALTDRDIVTRVVAEGKDPDSVTAGEAASTQLVTVEPEQDLDAALRMMAGNQVRRLPVVEDGRLVGMLAQADVAREADDRKTGEVVEQISKP